MDNKMDNKMEVELVRNPIVGRHYETTFWSRVIENKRFYLTRYFSNANEKRDYVGEYITTLRTGGANDNITYAIFNKNGHRFRIELDEEGRRVFYEMPPPSSSSSSPQ